MSTIKASNIQNGSSSSVNIALNTDGSATFAQMPVGPSYFAMRNKIINGAMEIDQRNAGSSINTGTATAGGYSLDRWGYYVSGGGAFSIQRSTTAPAGFINSYIATVTTADSSIGASDQYQVRQVIEGVNGADLAWGSASAKAVTVSFWVRSSVTGTYAVSIRNYDANRSYVANYSISVANTWEYKTITIPGDTSGTWYVDNSGFCFVTWSLGAGSSLETTAGSWGAGNYIATSSSVDWISTNGATFYLTGVQLEVGSVATPFERRLYSQELAMCQRYYQSTPGTLSFGLGSTGISFQYNPPVYFRATPTVSLTTTSPYWESLVWSAVGSLTSATVDGSHMAVSGGDIKVNGTFSPAPSYASFSLFGGGSVRLSAEL